MKEKIRSRLKFFAVAALTALMLACACASIIMSKPQTASAMDTSSGTVKVNNGADIYSSGFTKAGVHDLLTKLGKGAGASNVTTYTALNNAYTAPVTSATLSSANGGDLIVKFGGFDWTVTYLSKDRSGNLIATLYFADKEEDSTFSGWNTPSITDFTKYSNHYGGSYLRAVVLGNGGQYYPAPTSATSDADVSVETVSNETARDSRFYEFAQGEFAPYLVAPNNVEWQQIEYLPEFNENRLQNDNLVDVTTNWYDEAIHYASVNDKLYTQWGNDKIWLPSVPELGWTGAGIWNTSNNQRIPSSSTGYAWTRSGYYHVAYSVLVYGSTGSMTDFGSANNRGVRPAIHLNLSAVWESRYVSVAWAGENGSTTDFSWVYNTNSCSPTVKANFTADNSEATKLELQVKYTIQSGQNGTLESDGSAPKHVGKYVATVSFTTASINSNYEFVSGAKLTCNFEITPYTVGLQWYYQDTEPWDSGSVYTYNNKAQYPTAVAKDLNNAPLELTYSYQVYNGTSWGVATTNLPLNAGYYRAVAALPTTVTDYVLPSDPYVNYYINAQNVAVNWDWSGFDNSTGAYRTTYNTREQLPTASAVVNIWNGSEFEDTALTFTPHITLGGTTVTASKNASTSAYTYKVTLTGTDASNYTLSGDTVTYYIDKREITATQIEWYNGETQLTSDRLQLTYGAEPQLSAKVEIDLGGGLVLTPALVADGDGYNPYRPGSWPTADYTYTVTLSAADAVNYYISDESALTYHFSIIQQTVQAEEMSVVWAIKHTDGTYEVITGSTFTYTGKEPAIVALGYYVERTKFEIDDPKTFHELDVVGLGNSEVGKYIAYAKPDLSDANKSFYVTDNTDVFKYEIVPYEVEVTWQFKSGGYEYTGTAQAPVLTYDKSALGTLLTEFENLLNIGEATDAGTYTVYATAGKNFALSEDGTAAAERISTTFTIKQVTVDAIDWAGTTFDYDGTEKAPTPTVDGEYSFLKITVEGSATDAGTYVAFAMLTDDEVNKNYRLSPTAARVVFTIKPKAVDVKWTDGGADTFVWEYDGLSHVPAATVDGNTVPVTGGAINAGRYTAVAAINSTNYVLNNATQSYEIKKKTLTVTACDVDNLVYGSAVTSRLTVTYAGFADGENETSANVWQDGKGTVLYSCPYVAGSAVNTYPITPYGLEAINYEIEYVAGTLTVIKRDITVTINDAESEYGAPLANLTYRLSDSSELYNNDNLGITLEKEEGLNVGTYDITGVASNINYKVTFQNTGVYEIKPAKLTVKANDNTVVYGDDGEWANGYVISGYLYDDDGDVVTGTVTYEYSYTLYGNVGRYTITPVLSGLSAENYTFTAASGVLIVTPKSITVTIADKESEYGAPEEALTSDAAEKVLNGDDLHMTLVRGRSDRDDAGTYAITCTSYTNANYIVTFVNGTYTIKPYEIRVNWTSGNDGYEEDGIYYFEYNGATQYPLATYTDRGGSEHTLTVSGGRTRAGVEFTAEAILPKDSNNYVFAADTNNTCLFTITAKVITITWYQSYNPVTGEYTNPIAQGGTAEYTFSSGIYRHPYAVASGIVGDDEISIIVVGAAMQVGANYTAEAIISDTVGNGNYLISKVSKTCRFVINAITGDGFSWYESDGSNEVIADGYKYTYDGNAHQPWIKSGLSDKYLYVITYADGSSCGGAAVNAGSYKIVATPLDPNLIIPAGQDTFKFEIVPMTVTAVWTPKDGNDKITFEYNGGVQIPYAYFEDAFGNRVTLSVTSDRLSIDADTYAASVSLAEGGNYKFAGGYEESVSFAITEKNITVVWTSTIDGGEWKMEYNGETIDTSSLFATATMSNAVAGEGIALVHTLLLDGKPVTEIKNAGIYTIKVELAVKNTNYNVVDAEHEFEITRTALEITVDPDISVNYGDSTPVFDSGNVTITGFASGESAESLGLVENGAYYWVYTEYNENSSPRSEGYDAELVTKVIDPVAYAKFVDGLKNYEVTFNKGHITVIAVVGDVILFGTFNTGSDIYYNGAAQLPTAYYKGRGDSLISLAVTLMSDDSYTTVSDGEAVDAGIYYIKVSKLAEDTDETVLKQDEWTFEIKKFEVQVDIADAQYKYGDVTNETYAAGLSYSYYMPVSIDSIIKNDAEKKAQFKAIFENNLLGIVLNAQLTFDAEGYVNAGEYHIYGSWSEDESLRNNFSVKFVGTQEGADGSNSEGLFTVDKAQITVVATEGVNQTSYLKGDPIYVELGNINTDPATSELYKYANIRLSGMYDAELRISYVRYNLETYNVEDINTPERDEEHNNFAAGNPAFEQKEGKWLVNYKIEAENHEPYFGQWIIEILPDTNRINITFVKTYEIEYGEESLTGKELTKALLDGGYIRIDNVLSSAEFAKYATAYVSYGRAQGYVSAGEYTVTFVIDKIPGSTVEYVASYVNYSNINAYEVTPRVLDIDWGTTSFVYDGTVKLRSVAPAVTGFIDGGTLEISGLEVESAKAFRYSDNGAEITLTVTAESGYDFMTNGGHLICVEVDNSNYTLSIDNAAKTVSISLTENAIVAGLEPWLMYTLIGAAVALALVVIILIIIAAKRRKATGDDEGFYEDLDIEQIEESEELQG